MAGANVDPRGLWVRSTDGTGATVPTDIYVADGTGDWDTIKDVWHHDGTGWEVVWAIAATSPTSASAVYDSTDEAVDITIVEPTTIVAELWRIKRPDGTTAGEVSIGTTTFEDTTPIPVNGAYTVVGVVGDIESDAVSTGSLSLAFEPTGESYTVNNEGQSSQNLDLDWTNPSPAPPEWVIRRDGTLIDTISGSLETVNIVGDPPVFGATYTIAGLLHGVDSESPGAVTTPVIQVGAPTSLVVTVASTPSGTCTESDGWGKVAWTAPSGGADDYNVEYRLATGSTADFGDWIEGVTTTATSYQTGNVLDSGSGQDKRIQFRVQATNSQSESAWVESSEGTIPGNNSPSTPSIDVYLNEVRLDGYWFVNFTWDATSGATAGVTVRARRVSNNTLVVVATYNDLSGSGFLSELASVYDEFQITIYAYCSSGVSSFLQSSVYQP